MHTEMISIPTDTIPLDGALHLPQGQPVSGAALLFHGATMNFYTGASRFLPPALTSMGYACLTFNRRGHDILAIRDSRAVEGGALQTVQEGIEDNRVAAAWMRQRGFPPPLIVGHSYGGMLAAAHVEAHPDTSALILLSSIRGGREEVARISRAGLMAADQLENITAHARSMVAAGRGRDLIMMPGWWYVITPESFLDRLTEAPDILELAPRIRCPVLYVRGAQENPEVYPAEAFQARVGGRCDLAIIPDCDHFYRGREEAIIQSTTSWLRDLQRGLPSRNS